MSGMVTNAKGSWLFSCSRRADLYADLQGEILEDIMVPVVAGTSINLLFLAAFLGMLLWPLSRLVRQIESRNADSLEPLTVGSPIVEIGVLRDKLNRLIGDRFCTAQRAAVQQ
ncbi:MAG: hypothetical protein R3F24_10930 [Gammaproteobacteria bacterium]